MGIPDSSLLDLIEKVRYWISGRSCNLNSLPNRFEMSGNDLRTCCECGGNIAESCPKYICMSCRWWLCGNCMEGFASSDVASDPSDVSKEVVSGNRSCKSCIKLAAQSKCVGWHSGKIYPSESPRQSPEPESPSSTSERFDGHSPHAPTRSSVAFFSNHPSLVSGRRSPSRSDDDEEDESPSNFPASTEYLNDASDVDSGSISARHEFYSFMSVGSSPSDSPSRIRFTSDGVGHSVQQEQRKTARSQFDVPLEPMAVLRRPEKGTTDPVNADNLSIFQNKSRNLQQPWDFETNVRIWFPPPPDGVDDEAENNFFTYDDEDDDVGDSGAMFSSTGSFDSELLAKEKQSTDHKEPLRAVVRGHFRALVSQLLLGQGISIANDNNTNNWLDIITSIAWQAANFVRPDTSRGGSMDPCDYVKVKCVATGSPNESTLVKGIVCTKNIKHKRMTSQYKNPRLLLLGGALEYQRVPNQLASFDTLLQQENDHLKMIVSKIESHRPNLLLVEKSVSSFAQEHLLAREISLVLNVKRQLFERIARCTGAIITPSVDQISKTRLGQCELFHLEKVVEEHEPSNQFNRKPSKTLMFFEGCPRRLGCTVVLKGSSRQELKKLKHVVQYAVFAAYHLSLETSFLADEGASLPEMLVKQSIPVEERMALDDAVPVISDSVVPTTYQEENETPDVGYADLSLEVGLQESLSMLYDSGNDDPSMVDDYASRKALSEACNENLAMDAVFDAIRPSINQFSATFQGHNEGQPGEISEHANFERVDDVEASNEYYSTSDNHQSILVSFSSRCMLNGTVCERPRLLRIKFYGSFDKPLGRYLRDDLFDQSSSCQTCKEPVEKHVICYTNQHGNLTINVRCLPSVKLPGERDGRIWMWHRCLRCDQIEGVPPATRRVVMSDAAWGLSFGKFLELSFSNNATANRVASCGHSLQKDCLRFYGLGSMVAFFRYSPIDILSVRLPPSIIEFSSFAEQTWIRKEAVVLLSKGEVLFGEISGALERIEQKLLSFSRESFDVSELHNYIMELKETLLEERNHYRDSLGMPDAEIPEPGTVAFNILEINHLRHSLLISSHDWDRRLCLLETLLKKSGSPKSSCGDANLVKNWGNDGHIKDDNLELGRETDSLEHSKVENNDILPFQPGVHESSMSGTCQQNEGNEVPQKQNASNITSLERLPSAASILSDKIDSAWSGLDQLLSKDLSIDTPKMDGHEASSRSKISQRENPTFRRLMSPTRVYSFDSAQRLQERIKKGFPPSSLNLLTLRSFHASGDYRCMVRDPVPNVQRTYSQVLLREAEKLDPSLIPSPSFISSSFLLPEGSRMMVPQNTPHDIVITVYDNEPTSIISYALCTKEHEDWVTDRTSEMHVGHISKTNSFASEISTWQSFGSLDLDYIHYGSYGSEDVSASAGSLLAESKSSPHLRVSFEDDSLNAAGKVKFSVTCYFAKQFDALRKKCCPSEMDFVCSLSRCQRWTAEGGKSNVYFAKSLDERFIIKQVTKTELESFEEFAPQYFKYLEDSISFRCPTCLAKILGIYQVTIKHLKGGKEIRMDLMVMENLFFKRNISRIYDLKGSQRSRYVSDTKGMNKVLLDMNLLETLRTKPIFLGSKAKRSLERAVWNDTSFLASVDVMDYSLLVGVDEERKELVLGIIDFMRQYTWDKHLETWVKASGILGGPTNASPTIISPKQYKKRFRKAMTSYFLTVPDQWSS